MELLIFLILFPLLAALLMWVLPRDRLLGPGVIAAAVITIAATVYFLGTNFRNGTVMYSLPAEPVSQIMFMLEIAIALFILYLGIRYKQWLTVALILIQTALITYFEFALSHTMETVHSLFTDQFSVIMAMIIGIIGSLICAYAVGYMRDYHHHHADVPDRRNYFFFVMFLFLSAMFGLVFSNNLIWLFFFWEVTTLCSFLLIGYSKTGEATKNAFLALWMNLLGGIAFAAALIWIAVSSTGHATPDLDLLIASGKAVVIIPAALIGFAGLTKSAQLPFSGWLVGAMVAPTPVSALLHSSTMVKAGVYIIVRFAPVFQGTIAGLMLALVGGFTFLFASAIAISQSEAKKVLAYSTIANLGLIVACAGIGTYEAMWAAILLIIFHALAKSLLFMGAGTIGHRIGSLNIENMGGLVRRMPVVTVLMLIGMAGMFLAPFGMLISKWVALRAFIDAPFGLIFILILAFGGALTVFFWTKWIGKLISITPVQENLEHAVSRVEWTVLCVLAGLTLAMTFLFPLVSTAFLEPFIYGIYGQTGFLSADNLLIMLIMLALIILMPFSLFYFHGRAKCAPPYMGGRPTTADLKFAGSLGVQRDLELRNYYMQDIFGESVVLKYGRPLAIVLIAAMLASLIFRGVIL